jgi:hypothetical protein
MEREFTNVSDATWHVFGTRQCPDCGAEPPPTELLRGLHTCDRYAQRAHEAAQIAVQVEVLQLEIDEFLGSPAGRSHAAFASWCREKGL